MFELSLGITGVLLYSILILLRYKSKWDVAEAEFSKALHHLAIGIFWAAFVVFGVNTSFDILGSGAPPHVIIVDNNTPQDHSVVYLGGDSLGNWSVLYPENGDGIKGKIKLDKSKRTVSYLPADSSITTIAVRLSSYDGDITKPDSLSRQIAFRSYPYRKHYIFASELKTSLTKKLDISMLPLISYLLIAVAGLLGTVYHGLRRRKNIIKTSAMIAVFLVVLLYSGYLFWHTTILLLELL